MAGSERNLRRPSVDSQRGLTGSQRNLMIPTSNRAQEGDRLTESMPTLNDDRDSNMSSLEDSVRTNPELYLTHELEIEGEGSLNIELRHRSNPQNEEQGGRQKLQQGEATPTLNNGIPRRSLPKAKDSFNENTATESTTPIDKQQFPSWLNPLLNPLNNARKFCGKIVNDSRIQNLILLLITINAIMMGVATFPVVKNDPNILNGFEVADQIFLVLFTIESSMQLIYHGWNIFKDGFLVFDLLIVVMSWALEGAQVFRALRILRAFRLITRIDTFKNLLLALFSVFPKMTAIFMLLLLIFYIFSVMFTTLFKEMYDDQLVKEQYFDTLFFSLFTLFQMMTLDNWADILFQIQRSGYPWAWLPFVIFIIITAFVVVNLIVAVICDAVHVLGNENKAALHGCESDDYRSEDMEAYEDEMNHMTSPASATERRLLELQQQLDEMVSVQDQLRTTIEVLIKQLLENAAREVAPLSIDSDEQTSRSRTLPPTGSLGEQVRGALERYERELAMETRGS